MTAADCNHARKLKSGRPKDETDRKPKEDKERHRRNSVNGDTGMRADLLSTIPLSSLKSRRFTAC